MYICIKFPIEKKTNKNDQNLDKDNALPESG